MRSAPKARGPVDPVDEWGMYDPAKAGLEALFLKLGLTPEPIREPAGRKRRGTGRRRARRSRADTEGVCSAIAEARRRAMETKAALLPPAAATAVPAPPVAAPAAVAPVSATVTAPVAVVANAPVEPPGRAEGPEVDAPRPTPRKRPAIGSRKTTPVEPLAAEAGTAESPARRARPRKKAAAAEPAPLVVSAPATPLAAPPTVAPPPVGARFRRPAPLAAWARNAADVVYAPSPAPRLRAEVRVSWRSLLAIPADVAGVQYARGARIRRIVIQETE